MEVRPAGLYCRPGDFYIDPVRPVERAIITHGHADHARSGHKYVLSTLETSEIMKVRYGANFAKLIEQLPYGKAQLVGDAEVKLMPA
ncbi:MAG: DNA ligase-associated DEXH box helicase, partial [Pseudomonadota bacterium]|nr:DNA ligase-associated DEXH box helicase [Pseudomonadota bacterium]